MFETFRAGERTAQRRVVLDLIGRDVDLTAYFALVRPSHSSEKERPLANRQNLNRGDI
jgi:hypothetical protein